MPIEKRWLLRKDVLRASLAERTDRELEDLMERFESLLDKYIKDGEPPAHVAVARTGMNMAMDEAKLRLLRNGEALDSPLSWESIPEDGPALDGATITLRPQPLIVAAAFYLPATDQVFFNIFTPAEARAKADTLLEDDPPPDAVALARQFIDAADASERAN